MESNKEEPREKRIPINNLHIHPIDWINQNMKGEALELFSTKNKTVQVVGSVVGGYSAVTNHNEKDIVMFQWDGHDLNVLKENALGIQVGAVLSPFELIRRYQYRGNAEECYFDIGYQELNLEFPFIRVGTKYYKKTKTRDRYGIDRDSLTLWTKEEMKEDYGKNSVKWVEKYNDFVIEPDNKNYQDVVNNSYNLYSPFSHIPKKGKCDWSLKFMKHIFGEHIDLGMKYIKVLYEKPKQALPILVLVSEERQTGKSTFVDWLSIVFGGNMVVLTPKDIGNDFNASYADKNIIAIEESVFDGRQTQEKLKALATQKKIMVNPKFVPQYSLPFFGKLIITSNDENKFSRVEDKEIRYWVRKIGSINGEANHNILEDLTNEIPAFLDYLDNKVEAIKYGKSRQVFTGEEIGTEALEQVKEESKDWLHKEIDILMDDFMENNAGMDILYFTAVDLKTNWFDKLSNVSRGYILKVLRTSMKLTTTEKSLRYTPMFNYTGASKAGKPFTVKNKYFKNQVSALSEPLEDEDGIPF